MQAFAISTSEPQARPGAFRTLVKAVISGSLVAIAGLGIWGGLLTAAKMYPSFLPFVAPTMAAVLIAGVAYLKLGAWPRTGREFRREAVPLGAVAPRPFLFSLAAAWSAMFAGFLFYAAHRALAGLGGESALALPHLPASLLLPGLVMAGIVAGVVEEIAFRGFMQGTLAKRFGIVPAILISGFVWALFHTNHSYFGEEAGLWFAIFLAVATMLGTVAYRTRSLVPGIAVHAGFDIAYFVAAGLLQPRIAPIAFVQSLAGPQVLMAAAAAIAAVSTLLWNGFFRATR
jgi:membrane protease YdiL (CAAX protease family)